MTHYFNSHSANSSMFAFFLLPYSLQRLNGAKVQLRKSTKVLHSITLLINILFKRLTFYIFLLYLSTQTLNYENEFCKKTDYGKKNGRIILAGTG